MIMSSMITIPNTEDFIIVARLMKPSGYRLHAIPKIELHEDYAMIVSWSVRQNKPIKNNISKISFDDVEICQKHTWSKHANGYICTRNEGKTILLHQLVMNGMMIDHINGDKTDNRRENLRFVTKAQNSMNCKVLSTNTSGRKGVSRDNRSDPADPHAWRAYINVDGKRVNLVYGVSLGEAIKARDEAEKKYHGEYARKKDVDS